MRNRILEYLPPQWRPGRLKERAESLPDMRHWMEDAEKLVAKHPGPSLATAFAIGVAVAWWIKRR
jgi:ElaB/YqjD/DUF883 family membrane-anchored ribosome-binding protein